MRYTPGKSPLVPRRTKAFPWTSAPAYLGRDDDRAYGHTFQRRVRAMGVSATGRSRLHRRGKMAMRNA